MLKDQDSRGGDASTQNKNYHRTTSLLTLIGRAYLGKAPASAAHTATSQKQHTTHQLMEADQDRKVCISAVESRMNAAQQGAAADASTPGKDPSWWL
jgi:hypothetical protein